MTKIKEEIRKCLEMNQNESTASKKKLKLKKNKIKKKAQHHKVDKM